MLVVTHEIQFAREVADRVLFSMAAASSRKAPPARCCTTPAMSARRISCAASPIRSDPAASDICP